MELGDQGSRDGAARLTDTWTVALRRFMSLEASDLCCGALLRTSSMTYKGTRRPGSGDGHGTHR